MSGVQGKQVQDELPDGLMPDGEATLPGHLFKDFVERSRMTRAKRGETIVSRGGDAWDVFLIRAGRVQITMPSGTGRDVILRDMGPGRIFGEMAALDGQARSASVLAQEDSELAQMHSEEFVRVLGEVPEAGLWMSRQLAARIRNLSEKVLELATMPVAGRVQAELLRLASMAPVRDDSVRIAPMPTHADIAARIGSHREAVSRELAQLAREKLLRQSGRSMEILSLSGLKASHARFTR